MPRYRAKYPIAYSGRVEPGQVVVMDEETANSYGSRYLERLDEPEQQEASAQPSVNAESHTRAEIDEIARGYGLDPDDYNNKQEVADAINEAV